MPKKPKRPKPIAVPKKKNKYDITVKTNLTPDELLKLAINTPPKKKEKKN